MTNSQTNKSFMAQENKHLKSENKKLRKLIWDLYNHPNQLTQKQRNMHSDILGGIYNPDYQGEP